MSVCRSKIFLSYLFHNYFDLILSNFHDFEEVFTFLNVLGSESSTSSSEPERKKTKIFRYNRETKNFSSSDEDEKRGFFQKRKKSKDSFSSEASGTESTFSIRTLFAKKIKSEESELCVTDSKVEIKRKRSFFSRKREDTQSLGSASSSSSDIEVHPKKSFIKKRAVRDASEERLKNTFFKRTGSEKSFVEEIQDFKHKYIKRLERPRNTKIEEIKKWGEQMSIQSLDSINSFSTKSLDKAITVETYKYTDADSQTDCAYNDTDKSAIKQFFDKFKKKVNETEPVINVEVEKEEKTIEEFVETTEKDTEEEKTDTEIVVEEPKLNKEPIPPKKTKLRRRKVTPVFERNKDSSTEREGDVKKFPKTCDLSKNLKKTIEQEKHKKNFRKTSKFLAKKTQKKANEKTKTEIIRNYSVNECSVKEETPQPSAISLPGTKSKITLKDDFKSEVFEYKFKTVPIYPYNEINKKSDTAEYIIKNMGKTISKRHKMNQYLVGIANTIEKSKKRGPFNKNTQNNKPNQDITLLLKPTISIKNNLENSEPETKQIQEPNSKTNTAIENPDKVMKINQFKSLSSPASRSKINLSPRKRPSVSSPSSKTVLNSSRETNEKRNTEKLNTAISCLRKDKSVINKYNFTDEKNLNHERKTVKFHILNESPSNNVVIFKTANIPQETKIVRSPRVFVKEPETKIKSIENMIESKSPKLKKRSKYMKKVEEITEQIITPSKTSLNEPKKKTKFTKFSKNLDKKDPIKVLEKLEKELSIQVSGFETALPKEQRPKTCQTLWTRKNLEPPPTSGSEKYYNDFYKEKIRIEKMKKQLEIQEKYIDFRKQSSTINKPPPVGTLQVKSPRNSEVIRTVQQKESNQIVEKQSEPLGKERKRPIVNSFIVSNKPFRKEKKELKKNIKKKEKIEINHETNQPITPPTQMSLMNLGDIIEDIRNEISQESIPPPPTPPENLARTKITLSEKKSPIAPIIRLYPPPSNGRTRKNRQTTTLPGASTRTQINEDLSTSTSTLGTQKSQEFVEIPQTINLPVPNTIQPLITQPSYDMIDAVYKEELNSLLSELNKPDPDPIDLLEPITNISWLTYDNPYRGCTRGSTDYIPSIRESKSRKKWTPPDRDKKIIIAGKVRKTR